MKENIPWRIVGQFDNLTIEDAKENRIALVACYDTAVPNYERSQERAALIVSAVNSHEAAQRLAETLESISALIEEEMGEWYSVEFAHLPNRFANLAHMRDAIAPALAEWEAVK